MGRILFLLILFVVGYVVWKRVKLALENRSSTQDQLPPTKKSGNEQVVKCTYCGLHIPHKEAIIFQNKHYCSEDHAHLDHKA